MSHCYLSGIPFPTRPRARAWKTFSLLLSLLFFVPFFFFVFPARARESIEKCYDEFSFFRSFHKKYIRNGAINWKILALLLARGRNAPMEQFHPGPTNSAELSPRVIFPRFLPNRKHMFEFLFPFSPDFLVLFPFSFSFCPPPTGFILHANRTKVSQRCMARGPCREPPETAKVSARCRPYGTFFGEGKSRFSGNSRTLWSESDLVPPKIRLIFNWQRFEQRIPCFSPWN